MKQLCTKTAMCKLFILKLLIVCQRLWFAVYFDSVNQTILRALVICQNLYFVLTGAENEDLCPMGPLGVGV